MRKAIKLGNVWTARANLYNADEKLIGTCTDTPNAIANALQELPEATTVQSLLGIYDRVKYDERMTKHNTCPSGLELTA